MLSDFASAKRITRHYENKTASGKTPLYLGFISDIWFWAAIECAVGIAPADRERKDMSKLKGKSAAPAAAAEYC
jgi:hypothetical protein